MSFEKFILELFSFDSFLIIDLKDRIMITNEVIDKNKRFSDAETLLSSYLYL